MNSLSLNAWLESCLKTCASLKRLEEKEKAAEERRHSDPRDRYLKHLNEVLKDDSEKQRMRDILKRKKRDR